jgi:hypothetical protein
MSADNGIYIAVFADGKRRVAHCQAIDNCYYPDQENAESIVDYFGDAPEFSTEQEACGHAMRMLHEIMDSDFPVLEYGISELRFAKAFADYLHECEQNYTDKAMKVVDSKKRTS